MMKTILYFGAFNDESYLKFNNNNGYVNKEQESLHLILQTFTHFIYRYLKRIVIDTNIKGVIGRDCYKITNSSIHTLDSNKILKDSTNLGTKDITAFFNTHHCNAFCTKLELKLPSEMD